MAAESNVLQVENVTIAEQKGSYKIPHGAYELHIKCDDGAINVKQGEDATETYPLAQSAELVLENCFYQNARTIYFTGTNAHVISILVLRRNVLHAD